MKSRRRFGILRLLLSGFLQIRDCSHFVRCLPISMEQINFGTQMDMWRQYESETFGQNSLLSIRIADTLFALSLEFSLDTICIARTASTLERLRLPCVVASPHLLPSFQAHLVGLSPWLTRPAGARASFAAAQAEAAPETPGPSTSRSQLLRP